MTQNTEMNAVNRAIQLQRVGVGGEVAAKRLNAEFEGCYYMNGFRLMGMTIENGRVIVACVAHFQH